jgi:hypothetical protein
MTFRCNRWRGREANQGRSKPYPCSGNITHRRKDAQRSRAATKEIELPTFNLQPRTLGNGEAHAKGAEDAKETNREA